ncbi:MAG: helix-turn-helix domain-containing protein [Lachnospiraceae bacterium]|nr:helix-turn-helix domain-containing protein [Lachnospiraceae bacterium]
MMIGKNIKRLRVNVGMTQEQLAERLHISGQAVSKWENETALPDITLLPELADCFGVTIDELMDYKLRILTYKERFVKFMADNGILNFKDVRLKSGAQAHFYLDSENFTTNAQIAQIGEFFADCIRENNIEFDTILGLAYHGIAISVATACALYRKYGVVVNYCHDRKIPDSRGRMLCGYTLRDGDKVVIIDDLISSGKTLSERLDTIINQSNVQIAAVVVIADRMVQQDTEELIGSKLIEEKYHTKLYSVITEEDIEHAIQNRIV